MNKSLTPLNSDSALILLSYAYKDSINWSIVERHVAAKRIIVLLDSGAFSAWSLGIQIDLQEYKAWVKEHEALFWNYLTLDVVFDSQKTRHNFNNLRESNLSPIPIITRGAKEKEVQEYFTCDSEYIAFGGYKHIKAPDIITALIDYTHKQQKKIHLLGYGKNLVLLRPDSCDASTLFNARKYGMAYYWNADQKHLQYYTPRISIPIKAFAFLNQCGINLTSLCKKEALRGAATPFLKSTLIAHLYYQHYLKQINVCYWLVAANTFDISLIIEANHIIKEKSCT